MSEIRRRTALGWAAFGKVDSIMRSRKASMKIKRKVCTPGDDLQRRVIGTDRRPNGRTRGGTEEDGADYAGHNTL